MLAKSKTKSYGGIVLFLVLGVIIVAVGIAIYNVVVKYPKQTQNSQQIVQTVIPEEKNMPAPIYEVIVGDVKFKLLEVKNLGNILRCEDRINFSYGGECPESYDLVTTDKFIKVIITAQNIGKENIKRLGWKINEMVDNGGRKFYSDKTSSWVPDESKCSELLKPNFEPTPCTTIYEVSNRSTGLKVRVSSSSFIQPKNAPAQEFYIDLGLYGEKYCWDAQDCGCGLNKYTEKCFTGNKSYLEVSASSTPASTTEMIKSCEESCAPTTEKPVIKCIANECI